MSFCDYKKRDGELAGRLALTEITWQQVDGDPSDIIYHRVHKKFSSLGFGYSNSQYFREMFQEDINQAHFWRR